ncbi:Ldh family oxidoreductase [Pelagicoccus mobilis]|uniref:Ldh family oxidoreductase n=1 Tax=Pelagicoccus mobilis TaxID=415221 RepID=A0A934RVX8_9BACT|nr:Ldh family oxidoreductase [Pelagicoccus mobilis]
MPNMPPWGSSFPRIGNNPLVIAAPHKEAPIVLDMAMTQFSYGKLEQQRIHGTPLPVDGGMDIDGKPTKDAAKILESGRLLPAGFWKGSGLAFALDLLASLIASGNATSHIAALPSEQQISQVFLVFDINRSGEKEQIAERVLEAIDWLKGDEPENVRYPGERAALTREKRLRDGIPVPEEIWNALDKL